MREGSIDQYRAQGEQNDSPYLSMTRSESSDTATDYDEVAPDASAMIESMRAHGYTVATAIADLIDNSIAANSRHVWLRFEWDDSNSWISVIDDGSGMTEPELVDAMRLGSRSPLEERDPRDLGRFGLGLKTAAFSQARRLTVTSRVLSGQTAVRRWDLDYLARPDVSGWHLLRTAHPESARRTGLLEAAGLPSGTQVLLEVIDRVLGEEVGGQRPEDREDHFLWQIERVREHLAMVFHRFIASGRGGLKIFLNDEEIRPWDPFLEEHKATQLIGSYSRQVAGHSEPVRVSGFVLPHRDRFNTLEEHRVSGGPGGWNAQQGFYLYRGRRLIIAGDWLQLKWQKEEHFKLARIRIDIPNSMDHEWQIDVKKSAAAPPPFLREWLRGIAQEVRRTAKEVYAHRGRPTRRRRSASTPTTPWVSSKTPSGEFSYRIDRRHEVLRPLIDSLAVDKKEVFEALLRIIEETVPVQRIWIDTAENQECAASPFEGVRSAELRKIIFLCHEAQIKFRGVGSVEAWDLLSEFDGFQGTEAQAIIASLREAPSQ